MKFQFVFGFMLLILFFIAAFVGLPYLLQIIKSNQIFNFPRFTSTSTPGYFYSKSQPLIYQFQSQSRPVIKTGDSLYKGKVSIGNTYQYGRGQINLRASYFSGAINITGWRIRSAQRGETLIGKGINLPQFDAISSDIWLISGESIEIIAGISPIHDRVELRDQAGLLVDSYEY